MPDDLIHLRKGTIVPADVRMCDGSLLVSGSEDDTLRVWDLTKHALREEGFKRAVTYAILVYPNRGNEAPGRPRTLLFP